jgi:hypothetical protein
MPRRDRPGRPALPPSRLRTRRVNVRLSADEYAVISARADGAGLTSTEFLRRAALGTVPRAVPEVNLEKWVELARLAGLIAQIVRGTREGSVAVIPADLLRALRAELRATRRALRGEDVDGDAPPELDSLVRQRTGGARVP